MSKCIVCGSKSCDLVKDHAKREKYICVNCLISERDSYYTRLIKYIELEEKLGWPGSSQLFEDNKNYINGFKEIIHIAEQIEHSPALRDEILSVCKHILKLEVSK